MTRNQIIDTHYRNADRALLRKGPLDVANKFKQATVYDNYEILTHAQRLKEQSKFLDMTMTDAKLLAASLGLLKRFLCLFWKRCLHQEMIRYLEKIIL